MWKLLLPMYMMLGLNETNMIQIKTKICSNHIMNFLIMKKKKTDNMFVE